MVISHDLCGRGLDPPLPQVLLASNGSSGRESHFFSGVAAGRLPLMLLQKVTPTHTQVILVKLSASHLKQGMGVGRGLVG